MTTGHIPKVLFLNPWDRLIGPNRYLAEMLRQTPEVAAKATVVFPEDNGALLEYKSLGCQVAVWPEIKLIHPRLSILNTAHNLRTHTLGLIGVIRGLWTLRPDLVVSNSEILCVGGMAARMARIPHVQVVHSLLFQYRDQQYRKVLRLFVRFLSLWAKCFIGVSESVRRMLMSYRIKDGQIAVVPNGFDAQRIREKSCLPLPPVVEGLIQGRSPVLMSVGRIAPMKGQDVLVEAVKRLRLQYPSMICLMVGRRGGPESMEDTNSFFGHLMDQIHRCGLQDCVHFLGEMDYVPELLHHADVYVHPSFTESFSRAVAEALICGKPVVCARAGALPEVVGPQGGVMVPPGDVEALAQGIRQVLQGESLRQRIVSSGQEHVESHYSVLRTAPMFLEVLLSVANCRFGGRRVGNVF